MDNSAPLRSRVPPGPHWRLVAPLEKSLCGTVPVKKKKHVVPGPPVSESYREDRFHCPSEVSTRVNGLARNQALGTSALWQPCVRVMVIIQ